MASCFRPCLANTPAALATASSSKNAQIAFKIFISYSHPLVLIYSSARNSIASCMLLNIDLKNAFIIPISRIRFFQIAVGNDLFLLPIVAGTAAYNVPCVSDNPD